MATKRASIISGVYSDQEAEVMTVYPSIARTAPGRALGSLYESAFPIAALLTPLTAPLVAVPLYFFLKVFGERYMLTNRSVQRWAALGSRQLASVPLTSIDQVVLEKQNGQGFYNAADIVLLDKAGKRLMVLPGVPHASVFRETILKAADARKQVESSLTTIKSRKTVSA